MASRDRISTFMNACPVGARIASDEASFTVFDRVYLNREQFVGMATEIAAAGYQVSYAFRQDDENDRAYPPVYEYIVVVQEKDDFRELVDWLRKWGIDD